MSLSKCKIFHPHIFHVPYSIPQCVDIKVSNIREKVFSITKTMLPIWKLSAILIVIYLDTDILVYTEYLIVILYEVRIRHRHWIRDRHAHSTNYKNIGGWKQIKSNEIIYNYIKLDMNIIYKDLNWAIRLPSSQKTKYII